MSKDNATIKNLRSALASSERSNEPEAIKALEKLKRLKHSLVIKNHKKAKKELDEFTQLLVELFRD